MLAGTFSSLKNRNYRLYFFGQLISNTGSWLTNVALTLLVLNITHSGFLVGILAACQYGPILFLSSWAGAIADRVDKRRALLITQGLEMAQSAALAVVAFLPHPSIPALYILAVLGGIFLSFDNPLRRSFVTEMVPQKDIPNAIVLYSTVVNGSRILGPTLAGLLVVSFGYGWCFAIDSLSYIAALICIVRMYEHELLRHPKKEKMSGEVREGFRYILATPLLWLSFSMLAVIGTLAYNFNVTMPLFVTGALHSNDRMYTLLYSTFSMGAVACALVIARRGAVRMRHVLMGAAALGVSMLLLGSVPSIMWAIPVAFVLGISSILYMTATTSIVQMEAKRDMHGRVLALQSVFVAGTTIIGGPFSGWLADLAGTRAPILFGGAVCLVVSLFGYVASKRSRIISCFT